MAKTFFVSPGRSYTVTASIGSSVKYPNNSTPIVVIGANGSETFDSTGTEIIVSDDNAKIVQNFSTASVAMDKEAAEQAAQAARDAQSAAAQEATRAEGYASQLGDAALKGADNTFSGVNTFSGKIDGAGQIGGTGIRNVCPADFDAFSWVQSVEDFAAAGVDLNELEYFYWRTPNIKFDRKPLFGENSKIKYLVFYSDLTEPFKNSLGVANSAFVYGAKNLKRAVINCPNATTGGGNALGAANSVGIVTYLDELVINTPNLNYVAVKQYGAHKLTLINNATSLSDICYQRTPSISQLLIPRNVYATVKLRYATSLTKIHPGFPNATSIVIDQSKLDKESAVGIFDSLKTAPEGKSYTITLGIHIDHQNDEEVRAAIDAATAKGWTVSVQWNGTATASTFALRPAPPLPVYAKVDTCTREDGTEEQTLNWCHQVTSPDGKTPEALGYTMFENIQAAREHFNLPEPEEYNIEE